MLKKYFTAIMLYFFSMNYTKGQSAGDIAFMAFNADGDDDFAIVVLSSISASTTFYFSDNEPNSDGSSFNTGEGQLKWVSPSSTINPGQIVVFTDTDSDGNASFGASTGTLTKPFGSAPNLAAGGDALYAVTGSDNGSAITVTTWIAGIQNESSNEGTYFSQTGLSTSSTFINFYSSGSPDGGYYSGSKSGQTAFSGYLTLLANNSNWTTETSNGENILPISTDLFTILSVTISGNSGFRMMSSPVSGAIFSDLLAELWIQGMTGGDVTDGTANVWTLNVSGQSWSALTNLSTASLTAGEGFLVYVFEDTDWDGDSDLPVTLSVSGTENSSSASISSISNGNYALAGNPYASTIDWDLVTKTNLSGTTSVWDDAASGWKSWNGSSGGLTNGLIAPFQGFWIEASGGTGSITIETADKSTSSGAFYRTMDDSTGSVSFIVTTQDYTDQTFMSFMTSGEAGLDNADGRKLLPLQASPRVVGLSYAEETGLDIHNLPFENDGTISFPLDVMLLSLNESNYVTEVGDVTLSWNLDQLPDHVDLTLIDNFTNTETDLSLVNTLTFSTEPKGSFSAVPDGPVGPYPVVGDPRFTLIVTYEALSSNPQETIPREFALHPVYPNPFNPSATVKFDLPDVGAITFNVYDVKGALVETLLNETLKPGSHTYTWEPQSLPSGVYFIRLTTANGTFTQKVTYIK